MLQYRIHPGYFNYMLCYFGISHIWGNMYPIPNEEAVFFAFNYEQGEIEYCTMHDVSIFINVEFI